MTYSAVNFLEKNRNFLPLEVIQLLRRSKYDIIRSQFQCPLTKTGNLYSSNIQPTQNQIYSPDFAPLKKGIFGSQVRQMRAILVLYSDFFFVLFFEKKL